MENLISFKIAILDAAINDFIHHCRKRRAKAARAACLDPNYLSSSDTMEKSRCSVPLYDPDAADPYNMPKDCFTASTLHRGGSTDNTIVDTKQQVEFTADGRCTTSTTCMPPPPYGNSAGGVGGGIGGGGMIQQGSTGRNTGGRSLYESPKVSL